MQKTKLLYILIAGLLVSNLMLVGFMLLHKPPHMPPPPGKHGGPRDIVIERLHFNKQQVADYDKLIKTHHETIQNEDKHIRDIKRALYATLTSAEDAALKDSLIQEIANTQQRIEQTNYEHFTDIKKLCTPEQQPYFEELSHDIARLFAGPHLPKRPRR